jgi:hypothetical protein
MALQGPFVVVADSPGAGVVGALRAAGAFPIVETSWAEAAAAVASVDPEGLVLANPCREDVSALAAALQRRSSVTSSAFLPVVARAREDGVIVLPDALAIAPNMPAERIVGRLSSALRIRMLHATVLRRTRVLAARGELLPTLPGSDPLDEATVLLAGRGRSYPALSIAVGERVGLVGALSIESAARTLNARDIDGLVIGEGFSPRIVQLLLTALAEDERFRDLPVAALGEYANVVERFAGQLPNLERIAEGPQRLVDRFLPMVRLHAFGARLRRMLKSLDAKGLIDPATGLLAHEAFWHDLNRAVDAAKKGGVALSIARFSFDGGDRRNGLDAARLLGRLLRQVDFACHDVDNSIFAVFTETDLRAAHVIARRIASMLKNSAITADPKHLDIEAAVTLATLRPTDSLDSLIARVVGRAAAE